jgi:hypothetical protein
MPRASEVTLHDLRMRYRAAHSAYQACVRAVAEATMSGSLPSQSLLDQEAKALATLNALRAELLAAMTDNEAGEGPPTGQEV